MRVDTFLTEKFELSEAQLQFLNNDTANPSTAVINQTRNMSEMFLSLTIEKAASDIIDSNKKLAESADKHSKRLGWYTLALVIVGIGQIVTILAVN